MSCPNTQAPIRTSIGAIGADRREEDGVVGREPVSGTGAESPHNHAISLEILPEAPIIVRVRSSGADGDVNSGSAPPPQTLGPRGV